jgi:hypothetical protein
MIDGKEMHEKIVSVLSEKGPGLPMRIAKDVGISSLFVSAFLSELVREKRVRLSSLKVGGSPLYYLEGQEDRLEEFSKYLHPKELEVFLLLKSEGVLKDNDQDSVGRVALRSLKDFAAGFERNGEIYWKYVVLDDNKVEEYFGGKEINMEKKEKKIKVKGDVEVSIFKNTNSIDDVGKESSNKKFDNPLVIKEKKIAKIRSEFVDKIVSLIEDKGIEIIEELDCKAKEYNCIVLVRSELGPIRFLTQAKDKKTVNEGDLRKLLSEGQKIPLPVFMLYSGEISKKGKELVEEYGSVLKAKRARLE